MKKIVLSIIVALIAITANAQVYVGGTFGVGSDKVETEEKEQKLRILLSRFCRRSVMN